MHINAALATMRELARRAGFLGDVPVDDLAEDDIQALSATVADMAATFKAVDSWLSDGGSLPAAWTDTI